jgi:hypothetical protein
MSYYYMLGRRSNKSRERKDNKPMSIDVEGGDPIATRTGRNKKAKRIKYY